MSTVGGDEMAVLEVRGEHAMESGATGEGSWHEGGEAGDAKPAGSRATARTSSRGMRLGSGAGMENSVPRRVRHSLAVRAHGARTSDTTEADRLRSTRHPRIIRNRNPGAPRPASRIPPSDPLQCAPAGAVPGRRVRRRPAAEDAPHRPRGRHDRRIRRRNRLPVHLDRPVRSVPPPSSPREGKRIRPADASERVLVRPGSSSAPRHGPSSPD